MTAKDRVPKIRFKGFTETWEQCKLGDMLKYEQPTAYIVDSTEYDDKYKIPVLTAGQSFILGYTNEAYGIKIASKDVPVIIFDDFTTSSHFVDFSFKVKSSAMKLLTLHAKAYDFYFALLMLKNINYMPQSHERHWISKFSRFSILVPKHAEQTKIGTLFSKLDNLITLHQRKYDKFSQLKKALLEKMFPQEGESVPQIRFKGFTETWEQCKLGDMLKYEQPTAYIVDSTEYDDKYKIPVLTAGQSFILGYTNEAYGIKIASKDVPVIIFDDFTTSSHFVDFSFKVKSSAMKLLTLHAKAYDFYFALLMLKNINYMPQSHERHWISKFSRFSILVPKHAEQTKIGTLFSKLDNLITLHQRYIEKLKNIKSALLEKMFI